MTPPGAARSTFVLNVLGVGLVVALGALTYIRLTRTTSTSLPGRVGYVLPYCLVAGLWTWIALRHRTGRRWARIAGTISFALWLVPVAVDSVAFVAIDLDGWQTAAGIGALLVGVVGLASVVTMWRQPAADRMTKS